MLVNTAPPIRHRTLLRVLATIPLVDCLLNQLSNALHLTLGPLSLLQGFRGTLLLCFITICARQLYREPGAGARIPRPAIAAFFLLMLILSKELVLTGTIAQDDAVAYGQMIYWVLLWIVVSLLCTEAAQANILLRGLAAGAVLTAASVIVGYGYGGLNYYEDDAVRSSSGWFDTAKMITGILVSGSVVLLYLGRNSKSWLTALLALFCCGAAILTYARAGTVAMAVVLLWLIGWAIHNSKSLHWRSLRLFLVGALVASATVAMFVPTETLFARWSDVSDSDKAGSGRATIWRIAAQRYVDGSTAELLLGRGYHVMSDLLLTDYGDDVKHTHNDALDMLLVGGAAGACFLLLFISDWATRITRMSIWSIEGAAALAVLIDYLCHAQFTGQIWGTDAMSYYVVGMTSFCAIGASIKRHSHVRQTVRFERGIALTTQGV